LLRIGGQLHAGVVDDHLPQLDGREILRHRSALLQRSLRVASAVAGVMPSNHTMLDDGGHFVSASAVCTDGCLEGREQRCSFQTMHHKTCIKQCTARQNVTAGLTGPSGRARRSSS
jgi:hypothetical protein